MIQNQKILFTGDIGAAVFPPGKRHPVVDDFDAYLPYMEGFHRRYMSSNKACANWVDRVSSLEIRGIAPQHGAFFPEKSGSPVFKLVPTASLWRGYS